VFLNLNNETHPAALIVFDHVVSADPSFRKYWLLHSIEEPQTAATGFTVSRTKDGDTGKLHCNVLLPVEDDVNIEKVGGPGKDCWVFGENYPNAATTRPDPCNERGEWRVEVTPKVPAKENVFLNVMQMTDNSQKELPVARIDAEEMVGAVIADRVVLFSRDGKPLKGGVKFEIPSSSPEKVKVLVTDLIPGTWQIWKDGKMFIPLLPAGSEDGALYFEAAPGSYELRR
jgi:heparin/heparan-sulfate lyase